MKMSYNKKETVSLGYLWIDPFKGKWAKPLVAWKGEIIGYYDDYAVNVNEELEATKKGKEQHGAV
jgi:hypothetical protein